LEGPVKTCLAKDPGERWQSAHDLRAALEWVRDSISQSAVTVPLPPKRRIWAYPGWILAALLLLTSVALAWALFRSTRTAQRVVRFELPETERIRYALSIALSPDGRQLAFVTRTEGREFLWVRALNSVESRMLPGTENPSFPFWSPDSRFIGFFADGKLKKIDSSGGGPQTLCEALEGRGGTWNREDVIVFAPSPTGALYRVPASGGQALAVTALQPQADQSHRWPIFLPDGRH